MITCRSAAKINLSLDVLSLRPDGYHELQSVAHAIGLWDELSFEFNDSQQFSLECSRSDLGGENNLCIQAARRWSEQARSLGVCVQGLHITLQKRIPTGAGLGGGSGNAAATLLALNRHFDDLLPHTVLMKLAAKLGADVPFFLHGGCALFEGIGERLTPLPSLEGWVVIVKPEAGLSTPLVFREWDKLGIDSARSSAGVLAAIRAGDATGVGKALGNDLRPAAIAAGMDIDTILEALSGCGPLGAEMTGSGSAVYALFESEQRAREAAARFKDKIVPSITFVEVAPLCDDAVAFGV